MITHHSLSAPLHYTLLLGFLLLSTLFACQGPSADTPPPFLTEVITFDDGEVVVITRLIETPEPTTTPEPTIPIPDQAIMLDLGYLPPLLPDNPAGFTREQLPYLDPLTSADYRSEHLIESLYVGLTDLSASGNITGELALNWERSDDGLTWTFFLRDDLYWVKAFSVTNALAGSTITQSAEQTRVRPVSADDVVFALQRACANTTNTASRFVLFSIVGCRELNQRLETDSVEQQDEDNPIPASWSELQVRALDPRTVQFQLQQPSETFLAMTTLPEFRPIPREQFLNEDNNWLRFDNFLASGPFVLSALSNLAHEVEPYLTIERNQHWPAPLQQNGNVQYVNLYTLPNRYEGYLRWEESKLDITPLPSEVANQLLAPGELPPPLITGPELFYLAFNFDSPIFSVPAMRRAFSAAIDRNQLLKEVYGQRGRSMTHFVPPSIPFALPITEVGRGYNRDFARLQLVESGFGACRLVGEITYFIRSSDLALQHAETVVDMWVDVLGCDKRQFRIEQYPFGELLAKTRRGAENRPDLFDLGWAGFYPDASGWFMPVLHCLDGENRMNRPCSTVDDLILLADNTRDPQERRALYRQIEAIFFEDDGLYPVAPLYVRGDYELTQNYVTAFPAVFGGNHYDLYYVNLEQKQLEREK